MKETIVKIIENLIEKILFGKNRESCQDNM